MKNTLYGEPGTHPRTTRLLPLLGSMLLLVLSACGPPPSQEADHGGHDEATRGPHGGRILAREGLHLELSIFETGDVAEMRIWPSRDGSPLEPNAVSVGVRLARLGFAAEELQFRPEAAFLSSLGTLHEPHSFAVEVVAEHAGRKYQWQFDSFEGRTEIDAAMAQRFGIETGVAGPAEIVQAITLHGMVRTNPEAVRSVRARFAGLARSVAVDVGTTVAAGQALAQVESDESLERYPLAAPIAGVVTKRSINPGEHTGDRVLFEIVDPSTVWVEFAVFGNDRPRVAVGQEVEVRSVSGTALGSARIDWMGLSVAADQSVRARALLPNPEGAALPGMQTIGRVQVATHAVDLAVRRTGLQQLGDFSVVFVRFGNIFEKRPLRLGRRDDEFVEVLDGLKAGTRYVTANSYLIKADVEKSGATHEH